MAEDTGAAAHEALLRLAALGPVIPVIVLQRAEDAVPMAQALVDGGVRVLEVTLRTPAALAGIEAIRQAVPRAIVGAGTVRTVDEARAAHAAGSAFCVSPGFSPALASRCAALGLPWLPGVATASETMAAHAEGLRFVKFFPATAAGGVPMLKALAGPFPEMRFCPTGGLTPDTAIGYLALSNVPVCGGSWLTPADALEARDWPRITALAREAASLRA